MPDLGPTIPIQRGLADAVSCICNRGRTISIAAVLTSSTVLLLLARSFSQRLIVLRSSDYVVGALAMALRLRAILGARILRGQ